MPTFKDKLQGQDTVTAHICTIPSPVVTQAIAAGGADAVILDMEHGAVGIEQAHAMMAAVGGTDCAPLVRIPSIDETMVKRVLDMGAEGICFPLVRSAEDVRRAVAAMRYPPDGTRGFGPFIAASQFGTDVMSYRAKVQDRLVCMLLIETVEAVAAIDDILAVEGIDVIIPAQFDLSTALGVSGQFDHPDFLAALAKIETAADRAGMPRGAVALTEDQARAARARGARVIAGFDIFWMRHAAEAAQRWCQ